jgi:Heterokaryon incompatibility protein (HET)
MRLLEVQNNGEFRLIEDFFDDIPPYAILSHTWGADNEEVTFRDLAEGTSKSKSGYKKIRFCGEQAARDTLQYFWVDTCCIDKWSSTEISEAINSMFRWYKNAAVCYAYMEDIDSTFADEEQCSAAIAASRWFTRGWTLQELIAPTKVVFYSKDWTKIGEKASLASSIFTLTKIDPDVLINGASSLRRKSIARRMSWAAMRKTKRPEDIAYCLLGIFDVHMPLLYGEGESKAFFRLQEEIIKNSTDQSILAWTPEHDPGLRFRGALAVHPREFATAAGVVPLPFTGDAHTMTARGLRICLKILRTETEQIYWGVLQCHEENDFTGPQGIRLIPLEEQGEDIFARYQGGQLTLSPLKLKELNISKFISWCRKSPSFDILEDLADKKTIFIPKSPEGDLSGCSHFYIQPWSKVLTFVAAFPTHR